MTSSVTVVFSMSAQNRPKMKSNVLLVTRKVFLNLASLYGVAQTISHHPGFLVKRRQLTIENQTFIFN